MDSEFLTIIYDKKKKNEKRQKSTASFLNQKAPSVNCLPLLQNC